jgi:hypothetical protein
MSKKVPPDDLDGLLFRLAIAYDVQASFARGRGREIFERLASGGPVYKVDIGCAWLSPQRRRPKHQEDTFRVWYGKRSEAECEQYGRDAPGPPKSETKEKGRKAAHAASPEQPRAASLIRFLRENR